MSRSRPHAIASMAIALHQLDPSHPTASALLATRLFTLAHYANNRNRSWLVSADHRRMDLMAYGCELLIEPDAIAISTPNGVIPCK